MRSRPTLTARPTLQGSSPCPRTACRAACRRPCGAEQRPSTLAVARDLFNRLHERDGAAAIERHGFDPSVATSPATRRVPDRAYALVASVFAEAVASGSRRQLVATAERLGLTLIVR